MSFIGALQESFASLRETAIDEATMVTPMGKMFPKENVAIITGGGPGSGKGYVVKHNIGIDAKVIDVDKFKDSLVKWITSNKLQEVSPSTYEFLQRLLTRANLTMDAFNDPKWKKNSILVSIVHEATEQLGIEAIVKANFGKGAKEGHLPNVICDTTGKRPEKIAATMRQFKEIGYHTVYVWVVTDLDVAMAQNKGRARVVADAVFYDINKKIIKNIPDFLQSSAASDIDECWIFFGGKVNTNKVSDVDWFNANRAVQLQKKSDGGFVIDDSLTKRIMDAVGDALNYDETEG